MSPSFFLLLVLHLSRPVLPVTLFSNVNATLPSLSASAFPGAAANGTLAFVLPQSSAQYTITNVSVPCRGGAGAGGFSVSLYPWSAASNSTLADAIGAGGAFSCPAGACATPAWGAAAPLSGLVVPATCGAPLYFALVVQFTGGFLKTFTFGLVAANPDWS